MSVEDSNEAPNWLAKLEEQREKRLKAKLGHEAGAGAPCQNCGDKCPGLDLHFWRKICKLCKCGKEDHDISDDDIYGFVQFQLLGSKPTKAKNIFLSGKKDAITLDWTPKGSNTDVKKYLEELPEDMLPVKGSEAARMRKQRLQKQMPAHDIDASLCHALSPEEIQQLEEYVTHIRKHSVGQGKIIQLPLLRGEQHKFGSTNSQFLTQHASGQLASSQPVYLHPSNLANNLHNLSLQDKQPPNNRSAFLNSQLPNAPFLNTIDEQNPETVVYRPENKKVQPNYAPKTIHQVVDSQNPITVGKTNDLTYPVQQNIPSANPVQHYINKDNLQIYDPVTGENYYRLNPEYIAQMIHNSKYLSKLAQNPEYLAQYSEFLGQQPQNTEILGKITKNAENLSKLAQNSEYLGKAARNPEVLSEIIKNKDFLPIMTQSSENLANMVQKPEYLAKILQNPDYLDDMAQNTEYLAKIVQNILSKNPELLNDMQEVVSGEKYPEYAGKLGRNSEFGRNVEGKLHTQNPNINLVHSAQHQGLPQHNSDLLGGRKGTQDKNVGMPYLNQNLDALGNASYDGQNINQYGKRLGLIDPNDPYNILNMPFKHDVALSANYPNKMPEYTGNIDMEQLSNIPYGRDLNYPLTDPENVSKPLPLTTSNVERHQEQFLNQDYPTMPSISDSEFKNRVPIPVFNAENKVNPLEYEQNLSSVGYIRDIDYNIPNKIPNNSDLINSNLIPNCHKCKKLFDDGSVAVSVDRTDSLWHANCFNCHTCSQPLADLLYFYHKETDNIYCGRDYALLKGIPRCAACDELIFVREYCLAEERTFHIKHFCCFECDEPLAGKQYLMENNQPNCVDCYEKLKAEKCTDCGYVIGPEEQGVSLQNLHWHATDKCFACKYCRKALLGGKMLLRNQNLFCSDVCFKTYHA